MTSSVARVAYFTNVVNPRSAVSRKSEFRPTLVKRGATIGANATIVCGHTIGSYAFIAAGAVVTKDVPDFALMAGRCRAPHRLDEPPRRTPWRRIWFARRPSGVTAKWQRIGLQSVD